MNTRERAICSRLKEFRETIRWSQADVGKKVGISRDKLASIEYGRVPLRYELALRLCKDLDISALWLVSGKGAMSPYCVICLSEKNHGKISAKSLLTEVYDLDAGCFNGLEETDVSELAPDNFPVDFELEKQLPHCVKNMLQKVKYTAVRFEVRLYIETIKFLKNRLEKDRDSKLLTSVHPKQYLTHLKYFKPEYEMYLTETSEIRKNKNVNTEMDRLLARVRALVLAKGMKAKLAATLNIPQSRLSEWLGGKCDPSGETTLRLLKWVEQQEHQK